MIRSRGLALTVLLAWLASTGCMTLREIPRGEYAVKAERKAVRVETHDGLLYEFDYATVSGDTLTGFRGRPDVEGTIEEVAAVRIPLDNIDRLSSRELDWRRTSLVGGSVVLVALIVGLAKVAADNSSGNAGGNSPPFNP